MSQSLSSMVPGPQTSQQTPIAVSNVLAHPGSTAAGIATAMIGVGQLIGTQGIPTTTSGWMQFAFTSLFSVLAIFGK